MLLVLASLHMQPQSSESFTVRYFRTLVTAVFIGTLRGMQKQSYASLPTNRINFVSQKWILVATKEWTFRVLYIISMIIFIRTKGSSRNLIRAEGHHRRRIVRFHACIKLRGQVDWGAHQSASADILVHYHYLVSPCCIVFRLVAVVTASKVESLRSVQLHYLTLSMNASDGGMRRQRNDRPRMEEIRLKMGRIGNGNGNRKRGN
eukprot:scaffold8069_cov52-Attheya_sp.AAC.3